MTARSRRPAALVDPPAPEPGRAAPEGARDVLRMGAIRAGEATALEELYDRHASAVMGLALAVLRDRPAAEETLVDVFAEVWERADRFDPDRASPRSYLLMLTRSRAIDRLRAQGRWRRGAALAARDTGDVEGVTGGDADPATPLEEALAAERRMEVERVLGTLSPEQRHPIELAFLEGLSHREIADRLGAPLGTVKTRIRQGLLRLRRAWGSTEAGGRP